MCCEAKLAELAFSLSSRSVVRHQDVSSRNWGRRDRFRLEVCGGGQRGTREISADLRGSDGGEKPIEIPQGRAAALGSSAAMFPPEVLSPGRGKRLTDGKGRGESEREREGEGEGAALEQGEGNLGWQDSDTVQNICR